MCVVSFSSVFLGWILTKIMRLGFDAHGSSFFWKRAGDFLSGTAFLPMMISWFLFFKYLKRHVENIWKKYLFFYKWTNMSIDFYKSLVWQSEWYNFMGWRVIAVGWIYFYFSSCVYGCMPLVPANLIFNKKNNSFVKFKLHMYRCLIIFVYLIYTYIINTLFSHSR